jgi:hypothetical protein
MNAAGQLLRLFFIVAGVLMSTPNVHAQITVRPETNLGQLEQLRGVHPRLFLKSPQVFRLQAQGMSSLYPEWNALLDEAKRIVAKSTPFSKNKANPEKEQSWSREYGNQLATLSFAWLMTRDRRYLSQATVWASAIATNPVWGRDKAGAPLETGLVHGHLLLGLAMFYDYTYDDISPAMREIVRESLRSHASTAARCLQKGTWATGHALQSNHTWVYATGVMAAGLALLDDEKAASEWIGLPLAILRESDQMLSPDGASQEGFGYYQYGMEYLLKLITLAEPLGFTEGKSSWWARTGDYPLAMMTPRNSWTKTSCQVDLSDANREPWYGPDHLLRWLARRNKDGVSQWLADMVVSKNVGVPTAPWLALLWKDPTVKPVSPKNTPTIRYFENMGIVSARSDWSGDESMVIFKGGNPLGEHAFRLHKERIYKGEYYHTHRDSNHFCLFAGGQWLIRNAGYALWDTKFHNTLTVDNYGQKGDEDPFVSEEWPLTENSRFPRIISVESTPKFDRIKGDATAAYAEKSGLRSFKRELVFFKPNVLVVIDRVATLTPRNLCIRFWPETTLTAQHGGFYTSKVNGVELRVDPLYTGGSQVSAAPEPVKERNAAKTTLRPAFTLTNTTDNWTSVVALSWSTSGGKPTSVKLQGSGAEAVLRVGNLVVPIDLSTSFLSE